MKCIIAMLLACLLATATFAQRKIKSPDLKTGIGYPYVFKNTTGGTDHHSINGLPTLSVEKPFSVEQNRKSRFSINPGLAYYFFKEDEVAGNIKYIGGTVNNDVVGQDIKINHQSVSAFVKFFYQLKLGRSSNAFAYLGPVTGMYLWTHSNGTKTIYSNNAQNPNNVLKVDENAADFFDAIYFGGVLGFQPNAKSRNRIKPSFEVSFYPAYLSKRNEKVNMLQFSVLLGWYK